MNEWNHVKHYYDQIGREYVIDLDMTIVIACQDSKIRKQINLLHKDVVATLKIKNIRTRKRAIKSLFEQIRIIAQYET